MEAGGVEIGRFLRLETLALNRTTDAETDRVVVAMKNSLSKLKTAKRFATHFSISLHFTSAGITVLGIDLQVTWTRAKTSRLFFLLQTFLFSLSLIFFSQDFFIYFPSSSRRGNFHSESAMRNVFATAGESTATSPTTFLKNSALPWRDLIGCSDVIILWVPLSFSSVLCFFHYFRAILCCVFSILRRDLRNSVSMLIISFLLKWNTLFDEPE